jgi:hypothetical protein
MLDFSFLCWKSLQNIPSIISAYYYLKKFLIKLQSPFWFASSLYSPQNKTLSL